MATDDPLNELLLDADEVDRSRITKALRTLVGIDTATGRVIPKPGFSALSGRQKVLAYLLGRKVAFLLGKSEDESVAPKVIPDEIGIPSGTVHPTLKELREKRLVSQTDNSNYFLANHQVSHALEEIGTPAT